MLKTRTKGIKQSPDFLIAFPSMSQKHLKEKPKDTGLDKTNLQFHTQGKQGNAFYRDRTGHSS